jgi:hypothetical protein
MNNLHQLKNNMKMKKNEETEGLMIGNVPLVEATRREWWWERLELRHLNSLLLRHLLYML